MLLLAQDNKIIIVTGGVRSGKSSFAQKLVLDYDKQVRYIATAEGNDDEMKKRIKHHKEHRPSTWEIVEETINIDELFTNNQDNTEDKITMIDCITLWTTNLLLQKDNDGKECWESEEGIKFFEAKVDSFVEALKNYNQPVVIVTNEVGWGGIEIYPLGRVYQDMLGFTNQKLAAVADEVYLVTCGIPMQIKGSNS